MAVTAGETISQTDMAAMATLANSKLLPVVNAISAADFWLYNYYDKYDGGMPVGTPTSPSNLISPQPNYAFATVAFSNLVTSGATYNGSGKYVYTVGTAGDYEILVQDAGFIVDTITFGSSERCFYVKSGETITLLGTAGKPVRSAISVARNWLSEYNRIRGDFFALLLNNFTPGTGGLFLNSAAIVSGPWVVGVNDPTTYPITPIPTGDYIGGGLPLLEGILNASYPGYCEDQEYTPIGFLPQNMAIFNTVKFICAANDAIGLSVKGQMLVASAASPMTFTGTVSNLTIAYTTDTTGTMNWALVYIFTYTGGGAPPAAPAASAFTLTTPSHVTWSTNAIGGGIYQLIATYSKAVSSGASDSSNLKVTGAPANFSLPTLPGGPNPYTYACGFYSNLDFSTVNTHTKVNALHPTQDGAQFACPDNGTHSQVVFTATNGSFGGYSSVYAICVYTLSNPAIKGVWVANTLPVPGNNVFLDQDMPPYIDTKDTSLVGDSIGFGAAFIGTSSTIYQATSGTPTNPLASAMRQAAPQNNPEINPVYPGLSAQPAQWLIRRDTDFVPFELGFNENIAHETYSQQSAGGHYSVLIPPDTTSIKIRIVQRDTAPGWYNGQFLYGQPITTPLQIYVKKNTYATPTNYDFFTSNNAVTIPTDGGPTYLLDVINNTGFNFFIYDPAGAGVTFDVYVELDFGNPTRIYFPPLAEAWSYSLDGTPPIQNRIANSGYYAPSYSKLANKPIPQNGYCIFKVRATRVPVNNSAGVALLPATGSEIVITLGQNKLINGPASPFTPTGGMGGGGFGNMGGFNNAPGMGGQVGSSSLVFTPFLNGDGSNMTITIPAIGNTTGDVEVFIVCLAGNEVVWQALQPVKVEVYANFQPIFFNTTYGKIESPMDTYYFVDLPFPTVFQYGLAFVNNFNVTATGQDYTYFPGNPFPKPPTVIYPVDHNIYNDMMTALALIT